MDSYTIKKISARYKRDMEVMNDVPTSDISIMEIVMALNDWVIELTKEERMKFLLSLHDWCRKRIAYDMMK